MASKTTLGAWLKAEREKAGITREQLAVRADVGFATVGRCERGGAVELETLEKILAALGKKLADVPDAAQRRSTRRA